MTTATATHPTIPVTSPPTKAAPVSRRTLESAVAAASDAVARVSLDDPLWDTLGPLLTAFVDGARRAAGRPGSPIGPDETVAPALRLRDLGRLAQTSAAASAPTAVTAPAEVEERLRSLQVATLR